MMVVIIIIIIFIIVVAALINIDITTVTIDLFLSLSLSLTFSSIMSELLSFCVRLGRLRLYVLQGDGYVKINLCVLVKFD